MRVPFRARVYRDGRTERDDGGAKGNRREGQGLVEGLEESYSLNCLNLCVRESSLPTHPPGRGRAQRERERATATLCPNPRVTSGHRRVSGLSHKWFARVGRLHPHTIFYSSIQAGSPRKRVHCKRTERPAPVRQIYLRPGRTTLMVEAR